MKSETAYLTEPDPGLAPSLAPGDGDSSANSVLTEFLGLVVRLTGARAGAIRAPTADASQLRLIAWRAWVVIGLVGTGLAAAAGWVVYWMLNR